MLRIVGEVYQDKNEQRIDDVSSIELLNRFLNKKLEKMDSDIALRTLSEIGKIFIQEDFNTDSEISIGYHISEEVIREKLKIPVVDELYLPLFTYSILIKTRDKLGRIFIDF